jgi:hypothetical protein
MIDIQTLHIIGESLATDIVRRRCESVWKDFYAGLPAQFVLANRTDGSPVAPLVFRQDSHIPGLYRAHFVL